MRKFNGIGLPDYCLTPKEFWELMVDVLHESGRGRSIRTTLPIKAKMAQKNPLVRQLSLLKSEPWRIELPVHDSFRTTLDQRVQR